MSKKNDTPIAPDEALGKAEMFVLKYKKTFIAVILIIILVAALKAFGVFDSKSKESTAGNQEIVYSEYKTFDADFEAALNGDDFNIGLLEVIENYEGTNAENKACLYAGINYARQGQYEDAIEYLSKYSGNDNIIAPKIKQTLGNCYSHIGDYDKAISLVLEAADMADNIAVTPACWRDAAAMYEAQGDIEEAMELYNRIKDEYPNSPVANEAVIKINAAK